MSRAIATGMAVKVPAPPAAPKYGELDVQTAVAHKRLTGETLRIYLDGVDVTRECAVADDRTGYVVLLCRDIRAHRDWQARGGYHALGDGVCTLRVEGDVMIMPGEPL